jgi:glycosyltransferase involved in cell wall biosynthesis
MSDVLDIGSMTEARSARPPRVSVIMPAYNVGMYIGEALDSVFKQTFTDYEVIVVNDGSPDTAEIESVLARHTGRIVYLKQDNRGLSGARNTAIRAARGEFIALLDPDDIWEPNYLKVQVSILDADPTIDVLYPNAVFFGDAMAGRKYMDECPSNGKVTLESLCRQQCQVMVSVTARLETVMRAGLFDESLRSCEDFDLWLRIVNKGGHIAYHRQVLVRYRRRLDSLSADVSWMNQWINCVMDKVEQTMTLSFAEKDAVSSLRLLFGAFSLLHEGKKAFFRGDTETSIAQLRQANSYFKSRKLVLTIWLMRVVPKPLMWAYDLREQFLFKCNTKF